MGESTRQQAAQKVRTVLDDYLAHLSAQTSQKEFRTLLFGNTTLDEIDIAYKPEAYTRFNLVEPLLNAVDLDFQIEPRTDGVHRKRWPDFKITSTAIQYIGEVKAMNNADRGEEDIKEYLGIEGFRSPYGILTDGVDWAIFGPPADGGRTSNPVKRDGLSLADSLRTIALVEGYWDIDFLSSEIRTNGVTQIERFPAIFDPDKIDAWALEKMPRQYRQNFLAENRSLQASLDGTWE